MTFEDAALLPRSEKVTFVTIEAAKKAKIFQLESGSIYSKSVDYWVSDIKDGATSYTEANPIVAPGQWHFSPSEKKVYVRTSDSTDPKTRDISIWYKFHLSNAPYNKPYDLGSGVDTEWLPYVESIGSIGQQLDDEGTGVVLETNSQVTLINTDGFFDEIFDTLVWENKKVSFYSWFPITEITEAKLIFEGSVESKDYSPDRVVFKVKDFVYKLRGQLDLGLLEDPLLRIDPSLIGTPKRRIYGRVDKVKAVGVNKILEGFPLQGTITILANSMDAVGTGTFFFNQLNVGDEITIKQNGQEYRFNIDEIVSDTLARVSRAPDLTLANSDVLVSPVVPSPIYNRTWLVAGHVLREATATITSVVAGNRFEVDSTQDMFAGDNITVDGVTAQIRRISGNEIVTQSTVSPLPSVSDQIIKLPIQNVYVGNRELSYSRDWAHFNLNDSAIIFEPLAEFNIANESNLTVSLTFTAGSRLLTTSATIDLRTVLKPRDWIRKNSIVTGENDFYEIYDVKEQSVFIRLPFSGTTQTTSAIYKSVEMIRDDSIVTCNAMGMEVDGEWIKTPAQAVRHMLMSDAGLTNINEASFSQASDDCDYILSMAIPLTIGSDSPTIKSTITLINESVFGALYSDSELNLSYSVLNSDKSENISEITDSDIISFSSDSSTEIFNAITVSYSHYTDQFTGGDAVKKTFFSSDFVESMVGFRNTLERTCYLWEDDKAEIIAQRLALFKSLTNTKVTVSGKMKFYLNSVNDRVLLSLDRLFKRLGGGDRRKIGVITSIKKSQTEVDVTISDMGNVFNRVPSIAPNEAVDYSASSGQDRVTWGYVVDNFTLTPDASSEENLSNNIIG